MAVVNLPMLVMVVWLVSYIAACGSWWIYFSDLLYAGLAGWHNAGNGSWLVIYIIGSCVLVGILSSVSNVALCAAR
jgi:hypothetical protein